MRSPEARLPGTDPSRLSRTGIVSTIALGAVAHPRFALIASIAGKPMNADDFRTTVWNLIERE